MSAIDLTKLKFGSKAASTPAADSADYERAELWLNFGYTVQVPVEGGKKGQTEDRFVSLPKGIPLDTQKPLEIKGAASDFNNFKHARNDLLAQILEAAESLGKGESAILQLEVQIRRVADDAPPANPADNIYARNLFAGK